MAPTDTSRPTTIDSTAIRTGVTGSASRTPSRQTMSARVSTVTVVMMVAWVLMVRRARVPASEDFHQSHRPVSAASTDTTPPPTNTQVAACHSSPAKAWPLPATAEITSKAAASK
jgi:hypothetical protein